MLLMVSKLDVAVSSLCVAMNCEKISTTETMTRNVSWEQDKHDLEFQLLLFFREDKEQNNMAGWTNLGRIGGCPNVRTCISRHLNYKIKQYQMYQENIGFRLTVHQEVGFKMALTSLNHSGLLR